MKTINVASKRESIIKNFFEPQTSYNFGDLYRWLASDVVLVEAEGFPWSGIYYGRRGVGDYMSRITNYIISQIELEEIYSCNEKVIAIGRSLGRVVKTKQAFSIRVVLLFTFDQKDKIKRVEFLPKLIELQDALEGKLITS